MEGWAAARPVDDGRPRDDFGGDELPGLDARQSAHFGMVLVNHLAALGLNASENGAERQKGSRFWARSLWIQLVKDLAALASKLSGQRLEIVAQGAVFSAQRFNATDRVKHRCMIAAAETTTDIRQ